MQIELTGILSNEGKKEEYDVKLTMDCFQSRVGKFPIVDASEIHFELENTGKRILEIRADGDVSLEIPCARCLEPVKVPFSIHAEQKVDLKQTEEERSQDEEDSSYIVNQQLDVDQFVYNEILINWPLRVLCKDDCKGICSHCGCNLNVTTCDCDTTELDPRMAAINDIFKKFKEV